MRRVEFLINEARRITENDSIGDYDGIEDDEIIQHLNDAQEDILDEIYKTNNDLFAKEFNFDAVTGQDEYDIPWDLYTNSHIITLEFTTGASRFYFEIRKAVLKERESSPGLPESYHLKRGKIIISPCPNANGSFRMMYNPKLPTLDKIRGEIQTATTSGSQFYLRTIDLVPKATSFALLDNSNNGIKDTVTNILNVSELSTFDILTKEITNYGLHLREYDLTSVTDLVIELFSGTGLPSSATNTGDAILFGAYATNVSHLPDICEKYLRAYAIWKIFKRDGCEDSKEQESELMMMKSQIIGSIAIQDSDFFDIPIVNDEWF